MVDKDEQRKFKELEKKAMEQIDKAILESVESQVAGTFKEGSLSSPEVKKKQLVKQSHQALDDFLKRIEHAVSLLKDDPRFQEIASQEGLIDKIEPLLKLNPEDLKDNPVILQNVMGIPDDEMIAIYDKAREHFDKKHLKEAGDLFLLLTQLNPKVGAFWVALGTVEEAKESLDFAAVSYAMALEVGDSYEPALGCARCLSALKHPVQAKEVLDKAIDHAKHNDGPAEFIHKANTLKHSIR